ncbi:MAG: serine/threonine-protein phosphatase [Pseudobdellovibrionaceae bacterium]|nr:serine/threonine-protein phosphatase [Pseudobdellovibrionaceae bacterium]
MLRIPHVWRLLSLLCALLTGAQGFATPQASQGILDLTSVDLRASPVPLRGEWTFYPNVLLRAADLKSELPRSYKLPTGSSWTSHPGLENVQYGTYALRILLPPHETYYLGLQDDVGINSAFELEIAPEGRIIARAGRVADRAPFEVSWWLRKDFPMPEYGRRQLDLLLRVSSFNYVYKGILIPPKIGEWSALSRDTFLKSLGSIAAAFTLLALAIYHAILFFVRRDDATNWIFAVSCLTMIFRIVTADRVIEGIYPEGLSIYADVNYRILYSMMVVCSFLVFRYLGCIIEGFPDKLKFLRHPAHAVTLVLAILPFMVPDYRTMHRLVYVYEGYTCVIGIFVFSLLIYHALHHPQHRFEARTCLSLALIFAVALVNDIGYAHYAWDTFNVASYGLISLFMGQSILVARKYRKDFSLRKNLQESKAVQAAFLPSQDQFPGIRTSSYYQVAEEQAGGDFYDLKHDARNQRFYAFIGDVTGHGIASALVSGAASGAIHGTLSVCQNQNLSMEETLKELMDALNLSVLSAGRRADRLMTFSIVALDLRTGDGLYVNAGHNAAFLIHEGHTQALVKGSSPLGLHESIPFAPLPFRIQPGTRMFLYTDGLTENFGTDDRTLKIKKLTSLIAQAPGIQPARSEILNYAAGIWNRTPPQDDFTFVILEWDPALGLQDAA